MAISGVPFTFVDTAGLRNSAAEEIEAIGIERAAREAGRNYITVASEFLGQHEAPPEAERKQAR